MYQASVTRSTEEFLNQFGYEINEDGQEVIYPCALKYLVTDCSNVYNSGVEKIEELLGNIVVHGGCYAHLRRYFIEALRTMKLLEVFQPPAQAQFQNLK